MELCTSVTYRYFYGHATLVTAVGFALIMAEINCVKFNTGNWDEWVQSFEAFSLLKDWSDEKKLVALPLFLDGPARQAFQGLTVAQRSSWTDARSALSSIFNREDAQIENEFKSRRQLPNETIATYGASLRYLAEKAFSDHSEVSREKIVLKQFLLGIDKEVAEETARQSPSNLKEAIEKAQAAMKVRRTLMEIRGSSANNNANQMVALAAVCEKPSEPTRLDRLEETIKHLTVAVEKLGCNTDDRTVNKNLNRVRWRSPSPRRNDARCFLCNERGHFKRNCPNTRGKKSGN